MELLTFQQKLARAEAHEATWTEDERLTTLYKRVDEEYAAQTGQVTLAQKQNIATLRVQVQQRDNQQLQQVRAELAAY